MRIPYTVGRWVRGARHYGRHTLIQALLHGTVPAVWLVGTRRIGKTSLLRQLELLAAAPGQSLVPLFWDLQGCATPADLTNELHFALADAATRFAPFGLASSEPAGQDAVDLLGSVAGCVAAHGNTLLLLIDEGEALLTLADADPGWPARLHAALTGDALRTILTGTRRLARLTVASGDGTRTPFLAPFRTQPLSCLDEAAACDLVRQAQSETPLNVPPSLVDEIIRLTNGHPYLIQYLGQRLFVTKGPQAGTLRPPTPADLEPDPMLASLFQNDFACLDSLEQSILRVLAQAAPLSARQISGRLLSHRQCQQHPSSEHARVGTGRSEDAQGMRTGLPPTAEDTEPPQLAAVLHGLAQLGYVRRVEGGWAAGSVLLKRWLAATHAASTPSLTALMKPTT